MNISYLICAAGLGTRTKEINSVIPKPLLKINDRTFLEHSLNSLPLQKEDQVIIICQKKDRLLDVLSGLEATLPCKIIWVEIDQQTSGQLATAFLALPLVPLGNSIALFNADTYFWADKLRSFMQNPAWEGLVPCSLEPGEAWSFARVNQPTERSPQSILEVTEKKRISPWCSVGFYFFRDLEIFRQFAKLELEEKKDGECFVSVIYNRYIKAGYSILMLPTDEFKAMGSFQQINYYWNLSLDQIRAQNQIFP